MLDLLHKAIKELPTLMQSYKGWHSIHVEYPAPRVERLWRQWGENQILLHRIHPCDEDEALIHPHPWPSAVHIVSHPYEIGISSAYFPRDGDEDQELTWTSIHTKILLGPGSEYEMTDRHGWHYVRPLEQPSDSVMVVGPAYKPRVVMPHAPIEKQQSLSPERFAELFGDWKEHIFDMVDRIDPPVGCATCGWQGRRNELAPFTNEGETLVENPHLRCPQCEDEDRVYAKGRR